MRDNLQRLLAAAMLACPLGGGFAAPAGAEEVFAVVRRLVRAYVDSLQAPGKPYGCYRDKQDDALSLYD